MPMRLEETSIHSQFRQAIDCADTLVAKGSRADDGESSPIDIRELQKLDHLSHDELVAALERLLTEPERDERPQADPVATTAAQVEPALSLTTASVVAEWRRSLERQRERDRDFRDLVARKSAEFAKPPGPKAKRTAAERVLHDRERNRRNQAARRARIPKAASTEAVFAVVATANMPEDRQTSAAADATAFDAWAAIGGRRQQQLCRMRDVLLVTRAAIQDHRATHGAAPGYRRLAAILTDLLAMPISKDEARQRMRRVVELEAEGGPWAGDKCSTR